MEAINVTAKDHPLATFMVHRATPGPAGHTQTFPTRVVFS